MLEMSVGKIRRSLKRFEDFAGDLAHSDMNTFQDRLALLMDYCKSDPVLLPVHNQLMSMQAVDFDKWLAERTATMGGMVGSGELTFPTDLEQRMAVMYQLLERINTGKLQVLGFARLFFATQGSYIDPMIYAFNNAVVVPLARELSYRIADLEEEMPSDEREIYPLANIQIIHSAQNVIQQVATGQNIQQDAIIKSNDKLLELFGSLRAEIMGAIADKKQLDEALEVIEASEELAKKGAKSLPTVKVLLNSLAAFGNASSIISAILAAIALLV